MGWQAVYWNSPESIERMLKLYRKLTVEENCMPGHFADNNNSSPYNMISAAWLREGADGVVYVGIATRMFEGIEKPRPKVEVRVELGEGQVKGGNPPEGLEELFPASEGWHNRRCIR